MGTTLLSIDAISDALHAVAHDQRGSQVRTDCPACGHTGRPGRRPVIITRRATGGFMTEAYCGCLVVDIARALDLPPNSLMKPKVISLPSSPRNVYEGADRERVQPLPANAHPRGVSLALDNMRCAPGQRNLDGVRRVAKDLDRAFATVGSGEWKSYATERAARDLKMDRKGVRNALAWLVARNIIDVRQLPAPGEEMVTARGKPIAKSGVKQYRLLSEREQIARIARRATPAERDRMTLPSPARQAARELLARLSQQA